MSNINGVGQTNPLNHVYSKPAMKPAGDVQAQPAARGADRVELGDVKAAMMSKLKASADVRTDKVADIRAQLDAGTYESDDKLNSAIDKLLDDLV